MAEAVIFAGGTRAALKSSYATLARSPDANTMSRQKTEPPETPPPSFEQTLSELEGIVESLERGDLPLEESLRAFERGVGLTRSAQQALQSAEQRVRILTEPGTEAAPRPFDPNSGRPN
jgi:exodeoxyribonuclease VII small subunit